MDPVSLLMVLALVGGLVVAPLLALFHHRSSRVTESPSRPDEALVDAINIAHIRVTGIAGLGFVLLALAVAVYIPSIGVSLTTGAALGIVFAIVLILRRRRRGPLPSSGARPGANTMLSIEMNRSAGGNETKDSALRRASLVTAHAK